MANPHQGTYDASESKVHSTRHFPVAMYGAALGLVGLGLAWRQASQIKDIALPSFIGEYILGFASGLFIAITLLYALKSFRHPASLIQDFYHPVRGNFFSAASLSVMLFATAQINDNAQIAEIFWLIGLILTLVFTVLRIGHWLTCEHVIHHANPAWFIPVVGNLAAPIGGVPLGYVDISWMVFGIGVFFWIALFTIIFYRLIFHDALSAALRPTLVILLSPPALAFVSLNLLEHGYISPLAKICFGIALFTLFLFITQIRQFLGLKFGLPWWAYSFPLAAMCVASSLYHDQIADQTLRQFTSGGILTLLVVTTGLVIYVLGKTLYAFFTGSLFRAPPA